MWGIERKEKKASGHYYKNIFFYTLIDYAGIPLMLRGKPNNDVIKGIRKKEDTFEEVYYILKL